VVVSLGDELDVYLKARRNERTLRAQLAAGELYQWVGDSEPIEEEASAAATWLGDHIGHRVEVRVNDVARAGILWLIEAADSPGFPIGWRIRVGADVWPLSVRARCVRWTATYRVGDPPESWTRAVLDVAHAESTTPGWASRYQVEDCAQDPPWLPADARLHYG
jgi:hypothetical protein